VESFRPLLSKYDPMLDGIAMPERFQPLVVASVPPAAAAAAPSGAAPPAQADDAVGEGDDEASLAAAAAPGAPATPAAAPAAAPGPQKPGGSSVYLSDKELLDAQSATDDGEVEE
jgi:hypothetical protein